ncbi:putative E3 ubiquitin-protein ligase LOG2 [Capsicum annuum]|nr:putative E3 ubiquitin-protein ligase LOG2 [Capsicum annuum]
MTVIFFAKQGKDCSLAPMKESLPPITFEFQKGFTQKFRQAFGIGIDFSMFEEAELSKDGEANVYPLAVKAEATLDSQSGAEDGNAASGSTNSQITQAVFEKDKSEFAEIRTLLQKIFMEMSSFSTRQDQLEMQHEKTLRELQLSMEERRRAERRKEIPKSIEEGELYSPSDNPLIRPTGVPPIWEEYMYALADRFRVEYTDPMTELVNVNQTRTVKEYQAAFDIVMTRVNLHTECAISVFINGLMPELRDVVRLGRTYTLLQA